MIFIFKCNKSGKLQNCGTRATENVNVPSQPRWGKRSREASGSRKTPEDQLPGREEKLEYGAVLRTVGSGKPTQDYPQKEPVCVRMSL